MNQQFEEEKDNHGDREAIEIQPKGSYFETDKDGYLINPASPEKIQKEWKSAIDEMIGFYLSAYGDKLKTVYIRGSVAKGEAIPGLSDIDSFAYVDLPKEQIDNSWIDEAEVKLHETYPFVEDFEMGGFPLSEADDKADQIFLLQAISVYGEAIEIPKFRPGKEMYTHFPMKEKRLQKFAEKLDEVTTDADIQKCCSWMMKNILRTGFEMTMERSGRYTRDLYLCYKDFSEYYPDLKLQMRKVLNLALNPTTDKAEISDVTEALVPWMIGESVKIQC